MTQQSETSEAVETMARSLVDVGEVWATHALKVARLGLLASARTLESAARAMAALEKSVGVAAQAGVDPSSAES
jgi:hypothetical protein